MHERAAFGRRGEEVAAQYLERKGYKVLERNYHTRYGELDIIASKADTGTIAFVEVKTRHTADFGAPAEAVTYSKRQKLRKTAMVYLQQQDKFYDIISFDVIEIRVVGDRARINWIASCF